MKQEKIGKFITECRKEKKLTQNELANKLGITDKAVSKWENGRCMPDYSIINDLCSILGISINELLNGQKENVNANEITLENIKLIQKQNKKINQGIILLGCTFSFSIASIIFARDNQMATIFCGISIGYLIAGMITLFKKEK